MRKRISRRQALLGFSSTLLLPAACSTTGEPAEAANNVAFAHGVASGDPDHDSVVIWTRVSGYEAPIDVGWIVAEDEDFERIAGRGRFTTDGGRDHTVKVVVGGLSPGRSYFYRFNVGIEQSPPGRTRTLAAGHLEQLVIAVASCSNYPFGHFNAYEVIAYDPEIDVVAHLGDYIYEYSEDGYGGETGRRIDRVHEPRHEIVTLDDYRIRHAQYKSDPGSRAMHANHPLIVIWDDHESANNPWMGGAQNHQPEEGSWEARRAASFKAFYEWMPVRDPAPGHSPQNYWRHYRFGDLASLVTIESRHSGRSKQVEWGDLGRFSSPAEAQTFYRDVAGAPERNYLSQACESFVGDSLAESVRAGRRWRVIGNQSIMARFVMPRLDDPYLNDLRPTLGEFEQRMFDNFKRMGELGVTGDMDAWSGYPTARERFYQTARNAGASDLLVISGDSHCYWANRLRDESGQSVGVELGTSGITSPRFVPQVGEEGQHRIDVLTAEANEDVLWAEGRYNGFIRLHLDHDGARADYVTVTNIESRDYEARVIRTVNIESSDGSLSFT